MYGYIYKTTDLETNLIYIGQHKAQEFDNNYFGSGVLITRLLDKYGKNRFKCELLEWCESLDELNSKEIYYINKFNSLDRSIGYNIASGGAFGDSGYHKGMLGKSQSEYQKQRAREANTGKNNPFNRNKELKIKKSIDMKGNTNASGGKGLIFMNLTDDLQIRVRVEDADKYYQQGWKFGKCKKVIENQRKAFKEKYANGSYITDGIVSKFVDNSELNYYLNYGWRIGKGPANYVNRKKNNK